MATSLNPWTPERVAKLAFASFPGFGSRSLRKIWRAFRSPEEAWCASATKFARAGIAEKTCGHFAEWRRKTDPAKLTEFLIANEIRFLLPTDEDFPRMLKETSDPPEALFVRGVLTDAPAIAIVGTRRITSYGKRCVESIVPDLAATGLSIVSGMALGVDAAVHHETIRAGGTTVAYLGTGVDEDAIYPRSNLILAKRILETGGAIVSEFPPGTEGFKGNFPLRNRLIAGSSLATLVIEAAQDSGSLITAKCALEENREVLAVPGPIWSDQSRGTNALLKMGAKACVCATDILEAIAIDRPELVVKARAELPLDPTEERLLSFMDEPHHADELSRKSGISGPFVSSTLAILELKGLIKTVGGQMWVKS